MKYKTGDKLYFEFEIIEVEEKSTRYPYRLVDPFGEKIWFKESEIDREIHKSNDISKAIKKQKRMQPKDGEYCPLCFIF